MLIQTHSQNQSEPQNTEHTHVIKIGGENASDLRTAEWLANQSEHDNRIAVAISALRTKPLNTTTELLHARDAFNTRGMQAAMPILENLFRVHRETLEEAGMYDARLGERIRNLFEQYFPQGLEFPETYLPQDRNASIEQQFIGYGEVMSAHVLSHILDTRFHVANSLIDHNIQVEHTEHDLSGILRDNIGQRVHRGLENGIVIVPGYVSVRGHSILDAYGRGYTDKMAERTAVGLANQGHSPILHIQKQVPLYSSNPENILYTQPIQQLSYWSAAEITGAHGANARVLNEHTITSELAEQNIPVHVYNPFVPDAPRSIISAEGNTESGIQFIDGRDHVSTITVSGFAMSGPGLLSQLTALFTDQGVSIDIISSSETEVTFTTYVPLTEYGKSELWRSLAHTLGSDYTVDIKNNLGMIYCIGDNLAGHPGLLEKITGILALEGIDIECISQSRGQRAVTIGVNSDKLNLGIQILHGTLIRASN